MSHQESEQESEQDFEPALNRVNEWMSMDEYDVLEEKIQSTTSVTSRDILCKIYPNRYLCDHLIRSHEQMQQSDEKLFHAFLKIYLKGLCNNSKSVFIPILTIFPFEIYDECLSYLSPTETLYYTDAWKALLWNNDFSTATEHYLLDFLRWVHVTIPTFNIPVVSVIKYTDCNHVPLVPLAHWAPDIGYSQIFAHAVQYKYSQILNCMNEVCCCDQHLAILKWARINNCPWTSINNCPWI